MDLRTALRSRADRLGTTSQDLLLTGAVTVLVVTEFNSRTTARPLLTVALAVPVLLTLAWRRRAPVLVALAVCLLSLVLSATAPGRFGPQLVFLAVLLAIYSLGAYSAGRRTWLGGAGTLVLVEAAHLLTADGHPDDFLPLLAWAAPLAAGRLVRRRTLEAAAAATQATEVVAHRDAELRQAREHERDRIARELHDVVAHAVSLMVVQAGAERLRLGDAAPQTRSALDAVETAGRQALGDLRTMLGLLRSGPTGELEPQPRLADLPALVAGVREAGLPVTLQETGCPPPDSPAAVGLSAYRIVQESLTNVLKHAGAVPTTVRVAYGPDAVRLEVTSPLPAGLPAQRAADGRGLLGMQERGALHLGTVSAGPDGAFWRVQATLPLTASRTAVP